MYSNVKVLCRLANIHEKAINQANFENIQCIAIWHIQTVDQKNLDLAFSTGSKLLHVSKIRSSKSQHP